MRTTSAGAPLAQGLRASAPPRLSVLVFLFRGFASLRLYTAVSFILALSSPAFAWNSHGHRIVASGAYRVLDKPTRAAVDAILHQHPDATKWSADFDKFGMEGKVSRGEYAFMQASAWPDQIRRKGNPYDHPTWHYIDYPLIGPDFKFTEPDNGEENILTGIEKSRATLTEPAAKPQDRAASLAWLIHLVGDLHQPLHCATWVDEHRPKGDMGGNKTFILMPGRTKPVNLHSFMDGVLGGSKDPYAASKEAIQMRATADPTGDPKAWSLASRMLARKEIYGRLPMPESGAPDSIVNAGESFGAQCKSLARQQAASAGGRLGAMLNAMKLKK